MREPKALELKAREVREREVGGKEREMTGKNEKGLRKMAEEYDEHTRIRYPENY